MPKTILIVAIFAITAILIGSLSVDPTVFADGKKHHHHKDKHGHDIVPDSRIYVNSLTLDPLGGSDDKCVITDDGMSRLIQNPPCFIIDPFQDGSREPIFIADPALQITQTLIQVNVHEKDNFPTTLSDIQNFPDCDLTTPTPANINGINGILIECDLITATPGFLIDLVYLFIGPNQNFTEDDDTISECDCTKPTQFTVNYEGTEDVKVEIWKTDKDKVTLKEKLDGPLGSFSPGDNITIESTNWGKDKLESNTTYVFYTVSLDAEDNEIFTQIGTVSIHTSCSKDLFIDQVWSSSDNTAISLKVVSGLDQNKDQSIPPISCLDI